MLGLITSPSTNYLLPNNVIKTIITRTSHFLSFILQVFIRLSSYRSPYVSIILTILIVCVMETNPFCLKFLSTYLESFLPFILECISENLLQTLWFYIVSQRVVYHEARKCKR